MKKEGLEFLSCLRFVVKFEGSLTAGGAIGGENACGEDICEEAWENVKRRGIFAKRRVDCTRDCDITL